VIEDTGAPTVTIRVPPVAPLRFWVSWSGQDEESGLRDYDVQYKVGVAGTWTSWLSDTTQTQAPFVGEAGESYFFQVKATDNVNNASAWVEAGPVTVSAVTKYYYHGGQRVAMRQGDVVYYLHSDHLGSSSLTTDQSGAPVAEMRYLPYGEERWTNKAQPTDFTFTGQRAEAGFRLMDYNARYYDPGLGRFVSADTVVPEAGNPQALNRYAYVLGNPLRYNDPTGHYLFEGEPDDSFIWRQDKPANTLIRTAEPVVFWEETREPTVADLLTPFGAVYGGAAGGILIGEATAAAAATALPYVYYAATQVYLWANNNPFKAGVARGAVEGAVEGCLENCTVENVAANAAGEAVQSGARNLPFWPNTPEEMDDLLGVEGERIPNGATTPGRNKVEWKPSDNIMIVHEQHPYHSDAPEWHRGPHWHLDTPNAKHQRFLPGDPIPGY
jgi:RHS repeat-associated protein